jgi:hypothetical protein
MGFSIKGLWSFKKDNFSYVSFTLHAALGTQLPKALADSKAQTDFYDNQHHLILPLAPKGGNFELRNAQCLVDALPDDQAETVRLLVEHFQDVAIGIIADGQLENFQPLVLRVFFEKVATGTITIEASRPS